MKKLLVISADQERLGAPQGAHQWKPIYEALLKKTAGRKIEIIIATPEEASAHFADAEVVAAFPMRMPSIADLPKAKWLHSFSAGVDKILTPEVARSNIILTNSSGVHATPIAETIIAYCLMFARGFTTTIGEQRAHEWHKNYSSVELRGSTVLIVGLGAIGTETARLCNAFGAHVMAVARSAKKKPPFVENLGRSTALDSMLPKADYVVITLPHTKATHHLFNKKKFRLMRPKAIVINIGRGGIINEKDLIAALQKGTIAGAGLDVFEKEPLPPDSPLWDMQNVIITPHHSGLSLKYMDRAVEILCKNLEAYLKGNPSTKRRAGRLPNEVDKMLGY